MSQESGPRVVVVGGGVIGCAVARELAGCGCRVILLERDRVGRQASSAAAGILCPLAEAPGPSPLVELGLESMRLYVDYVEALVRETRLHVEFEIRGTLFLDLTREDEATSDQRYDWQQKAELPVEKLSTRDIDSIEPNLGDSIRGGLLFPRSGRVDPGALTRALAVSARERGAEVKEGCPVARLTESRGVVKGVQLEDGEVVEADWVILAAGAWCWPLMPDLKLRVFPIRGQMVALDTGRRPRSHVLYTYRGYLVPRRDGRVLVGSTSEEAGYRKEVTPRALLKLIATALSVDPTLEHATFGDAWAGLRPATDDGFPLLGKIRPGLLAATGHFRNGIVLAPVTAALITELVLRGETTFPIEPFSPWREPRRVRKEVTR